MRKGKEFKIVSSKYNGAFHRSWEKNIILSYEHDFLIGYNNKTIVKETNGEKWRTTEPALFYFTKQHWFNVIILFNEDGFYYYCNISSPFELKKHELHYIDFDIDFIVQSNFSYEIVDLDEYKKNKQIYAYPNQIQAEIQLAKKQVEQLIKQRKSPFSKSFIRKWSKQFLNR